MTEAEARLIAKCVPGLCVNVRKGTWFFVARLQTTGKIHRRYAGKNLRKALIKLKMLRLRYAKNHHDEITLTTEE